MTAALLRAAIALVAMTSEAMTTAVQALVLAGQKAAPATVAHRPVAVLKVADRAVVRPAVRRCAARAATMTMMMMMMMTTARRVRAVRNSVGPEWAPVAQAACPASAARRSSVVGWADLAAVLKAPDVCLASAARRRSAGCPACLALVALPAAGPALAADRTTSMTASPL